MSAVATPPQFWRRVRSAAAGAATPTVLRTGLAAVWLTALLAFLAVFLGARNLRQGMQTIGRDAAPSIIAAQEIKLNLAAMHGQAARILLGDANAHTAYDAGQLAATDGLLDAATNITYGDAEKIPIQDLLNHLWSYEGRVARARVLHDWGGDAKTASLGYYRNADDLMHRTMLPDADALDKANLDHLTQGYADEQGYAGWSVAWVVLAGLALLGALAALQYYLYRRTRRVFNPLLAAAAVAAFVGLLMTVAAFWNEMGLLKRAKEDCFDSINALTKARAIAQDGQAAVLGRLLDPDHAADYQWAFEANVSRLVQVPPGMSSQQLVATVNGLKLMQGAESAKLPAAFKGYLADELRNITFDGEEQAAKDSLRTYLHAVDVDRSARQPADALGDGPDQAAGAFTAFDQAIGKTLQINQKEFDSSVNDGFAALSAFDFAPPIVALSVALLAFLGLRPRLKEYAAS